ncbi:ABC transporter, ATP-binding protein [Ancylostoma ceylanicum]|uniref:ABC transporter, ATP-binding protein n=1 Tax=Ancylostoma ceylanicum TaxID=53326 RepID=A0A0D6M6F5_9BILA|nr:ABC transporter, ATP-binding protein [Ancylostoma ceylanicum]
MTVNANGLNIKKIDEEEEGEKLENGLDDQNKKEVKIALPKKLVVQVSTVDDDDESVPVQKSGCDKFIDYLLCRGDLASKTLARKPVPLLGLPFLALISGQVFGILTSGNLTDAAAAEQQLFTYVYIYIGVGILVLLIHFIQFLCFYIVSCRLIAKIRHHYIKAILRQNAGWIDKHHCGVLTTQLNDNVERIREGVGDKMGLLIRGFAMFFAALILSFATEWRLALFMCPVAPMSCLCMGIMSRKISEATSKELKDVGKAGAIAEEAVLGVRTVQALNGQEEMVDRFGGHLLEIGAVNDTGKVITVVISMMLGAYFLGVISPHLMVLMNARVSAAAIYHIIDRKPEIDVYSSEGKLPLNINGDIEFTDVHFRYPTRKDTKVLNGLNLKIQAGETVAFVGHSGCGKSTAVGLITRLYEAESGTVKIDDHDVRDVNLEWLRNTVGIVQQEPTLFNGTIEENLRVGSPAISNAEMIQVCKIANAHDFIMKLPQGYSTVIGEGAVQLSGGQKQRIAIARTLARNPRILLLDEATSALDANSESIVQQALDNASEGRTTIVIAHRLSTIRKADKIAVFEKGTIIELGTHQELIELGERYAELVRAQQFQPEADENLPPEEKPDSDRSSYIMSTGEQVTVTAESTAFEQAVQADMKHDGKITAGLGAIFVNAKGQYCLMFASLIVAICRGFEQPSMAFIYAMVFGAIKYYDEDIQMMLPSLVICLVAYIGVGLGTFLFHFAASVLFGKVSEELTLTYRVKAFRNILYQDAAYFDNPQHAPGRLITRLARDAPNVKAVNEEQFNQVVDSRMMYVIFNSTSWVVCIILALTSSWQVGIVGVILSILLGIVMVSLARTIQKRNLLIMKENQAGKLSIEIIENVRTVQLLTRERYFYDKYEKSSKQQKRNEMEKGYYEAASFALTQTFVYFSLASAYAVGIPLITRWNYEAQHVYRAVFSVLLSCLGVMNCSTFFPEFTKARAASGMMFNVINRRSKTGDINEGIKATLRGNLLFEDVHFSYPQRPHQPIMRGLQFTVQKGQTAAIVGPSGSGKSTVISLLERFYDATAGAVRYDGQDIRKLALGHVRTQVALVGQEPRLFAGTIKENICLGLKKVDDAKIREALEIANASKFLSNLPQGLDTEVGEKGTQLSGGQKQRIAIARALVRNPVVLLLDEATSALDSESEKAVQEALERARAGRTCITIAHRLSSIQNADVILYVENGKVREFGSHSELMNRKGRYYQLIRKQDIAS